METWQPKRHGTLAMTPRSDKSEKASIKHQLTKRTKTNRLMQRGFGEIR